MKQKLLAPAMLPDIYLCATAFLRAVRIAANAIAAVSYQVKLIIAPHCHSRRSANPLYRNMH